MFYKLFMLSVAILYGVLLVYYFNILWSTSFSSAISKFHITVSHAAKFISCGNRINLCHVIGNLIFLNEIACCER
jgi:hypothetical protein